MDSRPIKKPRKSGPGTAPGTADASVASTPAPPSQAELMSHAYTPRPFKNPAYAAKASARRNKTLKQILTAERDAAMGILAGSRARGRKSGIGGAKLKEKNLRGAAKASARKRMEREGILPEIEGEDGPREGSGGAEGNEGGSGDGDGPPEEQGVADEGREADGPEGAEEARGAEAKAEPMDATEESKAEVNEAAEADEARQEGSTAEKEEKKREVPSYMTVEAPPSLLPQKKYCDITGLIAPYTDPKTGIRYHSSEVYEILKGFGPGVEQAYLALRGQQSVLR